MTEGRTRVYLDHNATSPVRPEAAAVVRATLEGGPANPSSLHAEGRAARARLEAARHQVAALMGLGPREVVFTSGGSEAITAAVAGLCERAPAERWRIVVSAVEHSAVLEASRRAMRWGFEVEEIPCRRDGRVDAGVFAARVAPDVVLVALQWANNEIGVIQPVEEIGRACAAAGTPFLVDAVQAAGKIELDPRRIGADLMVISSHKIGGPQGAGALGVREGLPLAPLIAGGAQERRRRGGTEAVATLVGFGVAAEAAHAKLAGEAHRLALLRDRIEAQLKARFPEVRVHGEGSPRLPNTVSFAIPGVSGELLVIAMDVGGFALSTGSACASGAVLPSHVIRALGFDDEEARAAVRVSMGWSTTGEEVERFLEALPTVVERVRGAMSSSTKS